jgi:hypothetical protein
MDHMRYGRGHGWPTSAAELPHGAPVHGRTNMVNSPYPGKTQLVDVSDMGPGQTVKCPYIGKLFKGASAQQANNTRTENKNEPQNLNSEPKTGTKSPEIASDTHQETTERETALMPYLVLIRP